MIFVVTNPNYRLPFVKKINDDELELHTLDALVSSSVDEDNLFSDHFLFSDEGDPVLLWCWQGNELHCFRYDDDGKLDPCYRTVAHFID